MKIPAPCLSRLHSHCLLLRCQEPWSEALHARLFHLSRFLKSTAPEEVEDILPAFAEIGIYLHPAVDGAGRQAVQIWVQDCIRDQWDEFPDVLTETGTLEIPVCYDPELAPDLGRVAESSGLLPAEIIQRHYQNPYRVMMMGFQPGFAYLGPVPAAIRSSRRSVPRTRIPEGSVAVAGPHTGIYPSESPGGWNLIGRTPRRLFDPQKPPYSLLQTGMQIRFRSVDFPEYIRLSTLESRSIETLADSPAETATENPVGTAIGAAFHLEVVRPGMFMSIQDAGRAGFRHIGVPRCGVMDPSCYAIALHLLQLSPNNPVLEIAGSTWSLRCHVDTRAVLCIHPAQEADSHLLLLLDEQPIAVNRPFLWKAGQVLQGRGQSAGWAYLAVQADWHILPVMHSRSTWYTPSLGFGGWMGRPLRKGDRIPIQPLDGGFMDLELISSFNASTIPLLKGPDWSLLTDDSRKRITEESFRISRTFDRKGYRLEGPALESIYHQELMSAPVDTGTIELTPDGQLLVLGPDGPVSGGYPRVAQIPLDSLHRLFQQGPGQSFHFRLQAR